MFLFDYLSIPMKQHLHVLRVHLEQNWGLTSSAPWRSWDLSPVNSMVCGWWILLYFHIILFMSPCWLHRFQQPLWISSHFFCSFCLGHSITGRRLGSAFQARQNIHWDFLTDRSNSWGFGGQQPPFFDADFGGSSFWDLNSTQGKYAHAHTQMITQVYLHKLVLSHKLRTRAFQKRNRNDEVVHGTIENWFRSARKNMLCLFAFLCYIPLHKLWFYDCWTIWCFESTCVSIHISELEILQKWTTKCTKQLKPLLLQLQNNLINRLAPWGNG